METFGCSFFVHSVWVGGSNNDAVSVAETAESCVEKHGRSRRSRKRPAIEEGVGSCGDGVMMMTSPLTAKVGRWDTAGEEKRRLQHLNATFLQLSSEEKRVSLSHFKIISSLQLSTPAGVLLWIQHRGTERGWENKAKVQNFWQKAHNRGIKPIK